MAQEEKAGEVGTIDMGRIEAIRARTSDTRELVRATATYLFFECETYPSANKVFQLIGKGSMVTITAELASWWKVLREKLTPKLNTPDLPETISIKLAELGGEIWSLSAGEAKNLFEGERARLESLAESAARQADDANQAAQALRRDLASAQQENVELRSKLDQTEETLAESRQTATMLTNEVERRTQENRDTQHQLAKAQDDFSKELENQRSVIAKVEQRAQDNERKLFLEVDRARQETARKTEEFNKLKEVGERAAEIAQKALANANQQISELTQKLTQAGADKAVLEANLNGKIESIESRLSAAMGLLDVARKSEATAEARERALNEQIASQRAMIETILKERAAAEKAEQQPAASEKPTQP